MQLRQNDSAGLNHCVGVVTAGADDSDMRHSLLPRKQTKSSQASPKKWCCSCVSLL